MYKKEKRWRLIVIVLESGINLWSPALPFVSWHGITYQLKNKYVRFTKIQHTFKRWTIYEDRIADLSKRLKDERRGHTNHHVS